MNVYDLKTAVPSVLYKRGVDYFERDYVEQLTEDTPNRWHALVAGTRAYDVTVRLGAGGEIVSSSCNCPFESSTLCKHEVAVCLAIIAFKEVRASPAVDVLAKLKMLKKVELLKILEELMQRQPAVDQYLLEKFSGTSGMSEAAARLMIQKTVKRVSRRGFIEWERVDEAIEGVWSVQEYIEKLEPERFAEQIIRLSLIVIEECMEMMEDADDSAGVIESAISESAEKIGETIAAWPNGLDESKVDEMLDLIYPLILKGIERDEADEAEALGEAVMKWSQEAGFGDKVYAFIERVIESREMQDKSSGDEEAQFRLFQLEILYRQEDVGAVEAFYVKHQQYHTIRKAQVRELLFDEDFAEALRLCEVSEQMDADDRGLLQDWKELRFEIYEGMGSTQELIELSFLFVLDGKEAYYDKLKSLVTAERWPEILEALLAGLEGSIKCRPLYLTILIEEKKFEKLLDYCRKDLSSIPSLHKYLLAEYPHEVNEIYTAYIYDLIEPASNRKAYQSACQEINGFQEALGHDAGAGLIEELKFMYPNRRALLEELEKV